MRTSMAVTPQQGLAPRTVRLFAELVDLVLLVPLIFICAISAGASLGFSLGVLSKFSQQRAPVLDKLMAALVGTVSWVVLAASGLAILCLTLYQWYLLGTRGQTLGKMLFGIRIVDSSGKPAGFFQALFVRRWLYWALLSVTMGLVNMVLPVIGALLYFVDFLPLFGDERRCLHDSLAGTDVRWVRVVEFHAGRIVGVVAAVGLVLGGLGFATRGVLVPWVQSVLPAQFAPPVVAPQPAPVVVAPVPPTPSKPDVVVPPEPTPEPAAVEPSVVEPSVVEPSVVEPAAPEPTAPVEKKLYQFVDDQGVVHVTDEPGNIPERYRSKVTNL